MAKEAVQFYFGTDYYVNLKNYVRSDELDAQVNALKYAKTTYVDTAVSNALADVGNDYGYLKTYVVMDGTAVNVRGSDLQLNGVSVVTKGEIDQQYEATSKNPQSGVAVAQAVEQGIASVVHITVQTVATLPTTGKANIIYLVPSSNPGVQNAKDEFMWINGAWEQIGSTEVDLSGYATTEQLNAAVTTINATTANLNSRQTTTENNVAALTTRVTTDEANLTSVTARVTTTESTIAQHGTALTTLQNTTLIKAEVTQTEYDAMQKAGTLNPNTFYIIG